MIDRIVRSARDGWALAAGCLCAALLLTAARGYADEASGSSSEQQASESAAESPSTANEDSTAPTETADDPASADASPRPEQTRREPGKDGDAAPEKKDENEGSVDRALRKLATIPRPNVKRVSPTDREKTAGSAQYRLPSGTRVIVIQPGPQEPGQDAGEAAARPDVPKHSDGRISEPNRLGLQHSDAIRDSVDADTSGLGLQHRDAIRDSVSSLPIGDDIRGQGPDWQSEVIEGEIADRNDPRLRNATVISGPYTPYRPGYHTRGYNDDVDADGRRGDPYVVDGAAAPGGYYRFGFVRENRFDRLYAEADARTDRLLNSADKFRARGIAYLREGRYREAADAFKLSAETNHHDPAARLYAAHAYFAIGRYREAVDFLDRAFELQPKVAFLNYDLRDDYGRKADFDRHLGDLERALDRSPHNVDRLTLLGYILCFSNQREIAWEPLIKAYQRDPDNALVNRLMETSQPPDVELERAGIEMPARE